MCLWLSPNCSPWKQGTLYASSSRSTQLKIRRMAYVRLGQVVLEIDFAHGKVNDASPATNRRSSKRYAQLRLDAVLLTLRPSPDRMYALTSLIDLDGPPARSNGRNPMEHHARLAKFVLFGFLLDSGSPHRSLTVSAVFFFELCLSPELAK